MTAGRSWPAAAGRRRRVEAPLQHVALHDQGPGDLALGGALGAGRISTSTAPACRAQRLRGASRSSRGLASASTWSIVRRPGQAEVAIAGA